MRVAHFSDIHLLALEGVSVKRMLNKRFTGWVNLKVRRHDVHKPDVARAVAREVRRREVDHVVITGDLTNLALEREFEKVRTFLEQDLGLPPDRVSLVPGNHDVYTRGAHRNRRFQRYFGPYITSDLPEATMAPGSDLRFPYVRLRGPLAILGLSSAVPRAPLIAAGFIGEAQHAALHALLSHRDVERRTPVIIQHHPWRNPRSPVKRYLRGLDDAGRQGDLLDDIAHGVLLHGHLHRRVHERLETRRGAVHMFGSTSASLLHEDPVRMGGFNEYAFDAVSGRLLRAETYRLDRASGDFVAVALSGFAPPEAA
ncbi:MAG: metallophosphoesterase [Myxococcota bacterium]